MEKPAVPELQGQPEAVKVQQPVVVEENVKESGSVAGI